MKKISDGLRLLVGQDVEGGVYCDLTDKPHLFIEGNSGTGKSSSLRYILDDLIASYSSEEIEVYLADMKEVEVKKLHDDLKYHKHVNVLQHTKEATSIIEFLNNVWSIVTERANLINKAGFTNIKDYREKNHISEIVVLFDEVGAALNGNYTPKEHNTIEHLLELILTLGRVGGVHLVATGSGLTSMQMVVFGHHLRLIKPGLGALEHNLVIIPRCQ